MTIRSSRWGLQIILRGEALGPLAGCSMDVHLLSVRLWCQFSRKQTSAIQQSSLSAPMAQPLTAPFKKPLTRCLTTTRGARLSTSQAEFTSRCNSSDLFRCFHELVIAIAVMSMPGSGDRIIRIYAAIVTTRRFSRWCWVVLWPHQFSK